MRKDPKSIKIKSSCPYLFALLGSALAKAAREIDPRSDLSGCQKFVEVLIVETQKSDITSTDSEGG